MLFSTLEEYNTELENMRQELEKTEEYLKKKILKNMELEAIMKH